MSDIEVVSLVFVSFWFRFVRTPKSIQKSAILALGDLATVYLDRGTTENSNAVNAQLILLFTKSGTQLKINVPKQATTWTQVIFSYDYTGHSTHFKLRGGYASFPSYSE